MNLKHKVLTGNPTGNSRCQALASRALNTSCYFGQSARSIESRCVVKCRKMYPYLSGSLHLYWGRTVYPKKYAHGFVVLCFVVVMQSFIMNSHEVFIHIHQGCFAGTGAIVRLPQCQWSKPDGYGTTVYPKKYAHGFVVLCFVVVMQSFIMNSHEVFIHIHQGCFAGTGAIVRLPQCQWSKPDGYGESSQYITTTKHSKAKTVCIFLEIYCILPSQTALVEIPLQHPYNMHQHANALILKIYIFDESGTRRPLLLQNCGNSSTIPLAHKKNKNKTWYHFLCLMTTLKRCHLLLAEPYWIQCKIAHAKSYFLVLSNHAKKPQKVLWKTKQNKNTTNKKNGMLVRLLYIN